MLHIAFVRSTFFIASYSYCFLFSITRISKSEWVDLFGSLKEPILIRIRRIRFNHIVRTRIKPKQFGRLRIRAFSNRQPNLYVIGTFDIRLVPVGKLSLILKRGQTIPSLFQSCSKQECGKKQFTCYRNSKTGLTSGHQRCRNNEYYSGTRGFTCMKRHNFKPEILFRDSSYILHKIVFAHQLHQDA